MAPEKLREWRARLQLTQTELGRQLGVDHMTVYRWEAGVRRIPPFLHLALRWLEREGGDERKQGAKAKRERR